MLRKVKVMAMLSLISNIVFLKIMILIFVIPLILTVQEGANNKFLDIIESIFDESNLSK